MLFNRRNYSQRFWLTLAIVLTSVFFSAGAEEQSAQSVFDRLVEHWRWQKYWLGKSGVDDIYVEGKTATALIFWAKKEGVPKVGLCSPGLGFCIAAADPDSLPDQDVTHISASTSPTEAFASFVQSNFSRQESPSESQSANPGERPKGAVPRESPKIPIYPPSANPGERFKVEDYETRQITVTLPPMGLPSALVHRDSGPAKMKEVEETKKLFACWNPSKARPQGCQGEIVFPFHDDSDPYWYVLVRCSSECERGSPVESVSALRKGDEEHTWEASVGGLIDDPSEVRRLAQQIENAAMVRLRP